MRIVWTNNVGGDDTTHHIGRCDHDVVRRSFNVNDDIVVGNLAKDNSRRGRSRDCRQLASEWYDGQNDFVRRVWHAETRIVSTDTIDAERGDRKSVV
jgi:hypothetical protein